MGSRRPFVSAGDSGVTLVEMIVATMISGIIILATVGIYAAYQAEYNVANSRVDLERECFLTLYTIRDTVNFVTKSEYYSGGTPLFYQDGDKVMRRDPVEPEVICTRVVPGGFVVTPNADTSYIKVELKLRDSYNQESYYYTIIMLKQE